MDYYEAQDVISFPMLSLELLSAVRGKLPQARLAELLGVSTQQVYRWEKGKRGITWKRFLEITSARKINIQPFFKCLLYSDKPYEIPKFVRYCLRGVSAEAAHRALGCSVFTLSRWKNGKGEPSLQEVLKMIHYFLNVLPEALSELVEINRLPSIENIYIKNKKEQEFHFKNPIAAAITVAINVEPYLSLKSHDPKVLQKSIGIPIDQVINILKEMESLEIIELAKNGKYQIRPKSLVVKGSRWGAFNLRAYWSGRALKKFEMARDHNYAIENTLAAYNVFSMNKEKYLEIKEKYFEVYNEFIKVIQSHSNKPLASCQETKVFALTLQVIDLSENEQPYLK